ERGAARARRDVSAVDLTLGLLACISDDLPAAQAVAKATLASYAALPYYNRLFQQSGFAPEAAACVHGGAQAVSERMVEALVLHGPPARCREQLAAFRAAGIQLPIIRPVPVAGEPYTQAVRTALATFADMT